MSARKHRLVDCNPKWVTVHGEGDDEGKVHYLQFDCPEGHEHCWHTVPFTPRLNGDAFAHPHALWQRTGDTFETLTLSPSILRRPSVNDDGVVIDPCALHIFIVNGEIQFCGDSK